MQPRAGVPPLGDWDNRRTVLAGIDNFGFTGRIALRDGDDGFQGNLHWEQRRDYFNARVSGPLGMGTVRIAGDAATVRVTDKDGVETRLEDPEADLRRHFGWRLPIESLRYWALGIPDPATAADLTFADDGSLVALEQSGWQVRIDSYREVGGERMPRRLRAQRDDARVTLVFDRWLF